MKKAIVMVIAVGTIMLFGCESDSSDIEHSEEQTYDEVEITYKDYDSWSYIQHICDMYSVSLDKNRKVDDSEIIPKEEIAYLFIDIFKENSEDYSSINVEYIEDKGYYFVVFLPPNDAVGGSHEILVDAITGATILSWTGE